MTRVWLTKWEWECCGDAFGVGDEIDFGIEIRGPHPALADELGQELAATVDAMESHHEEEFADRVRGRVVAVYAVTREVVHRRSLRRPGHGAPLDAAMPADRDEWPLVGEGLEGGVFLSSRPSRYIIEVEPVPHTAVLVPTQGVRLPVAQQDQPLASVAESSADPSPEWQGRTLAGWLVDVQEH